jgi:hypothetical protein
MVQIFVAIKNSSSLGRFELVNLGSSGKHANHDSPDQGAHYHTLVLRGFVSDLALGWSWSKNSLVLVL